jgi:hypothetical protein
MQMLGIDPFEGNTQNDECRFNIGTARPSRIAISSDVNGFQVWQKLEDRTPFSKQILVDITRLLLYNKLPSDRSFGIWTVRFENIGDCVPPTSRARSRNICVERRCSRWTARLGRVGDLDYDVPAQPSDLIECVGVLVPSSRHRRVDIDSLERDLVEFSQTAQRARR